MNQWRTLAQTVKQKCAPVQRDRAEWLDNGKASHTQIHQSLRDLRCINAYLGNSRIVVNEIIALLEKRGLKSATILDVGTGSADLPVHLLRAARKRALDLKIIALDCKPLHLQIAREYLAREPHEVSQRVLLLGADVFKLPLADASVDVVVSSLFLHHFRPPQIERLLNESTRVARSGWVMNDLVRHHAPLVFFRLAWPVFARSRLTRFDSAASLRRAYTVDEMRNHTAAMDLRELKSLEIKAPPFRVVLVGEKAYSA